MYKTYLEIFGLTRFFFNLIIAIRYRLKSKYYYLILIELLSLIFLILNQYFLQLFGSVLLMSNIYGTINDLLFGWFCPDYWREDHNINNPFPLELSNIDGSKRPFHHSFIWACIGTNKYAFISAIFTFIISFLKPINIEIIIESYSFCFMLILGLSFQQFSILKDNINQKMIPFYINNYAYQNALFFNILLLIYLSFFIYI
jgi:hypothetical protein